MAGSVDRVQVLGFRMRVQQLDRTDGTLGDTAVLDIGVQDTGPDGGRWALRNRGLAGPVLAEADLATMWTVRGAPHLYRREDLPQVAAAVTPFSDADAGKRIYDAAKPLKAAGIGNLAALDAVATAMRSVVTEPLVKGEVSARVAALMPEPYLRFCRPCDGIHLYEMPFRLAAVRAGLELRAGTSPPVLQPIAGFRPADHVPERFDLIRAYLRLLGPATPKHVADYLDAPVKDVKARWPADVAEVSVAGETRWVLSADADRFDAPRPQAVRLLGPFDLFLQAKDRPLLVDDPARAKALWPVLGRPGAVVAAGELAGTWRPRQSGGKLTVQVALWSAASTRLRAAITEQAEQLAAHRQVRLVEADFTD
ncbi:winged helix DNA-binding domain-containing protein [Micromonospora eburnea]|uniref:winged helix DNA-binding domain-containing protein n=1 Tax=Micromonospora eburnea TaxID=227316 RepID=UPI000B8A05B9|nr:winged helix DNA-binding domain-containing protein [Micromonospora eburnea]